MEIAKIQVTGTRARTVTRKPIPAGLIGGYITVEYTDSLWAELTKTVVFKSGGVTKDIITNYTTVQIPPEVLVQGNRLYVGFYGTKNGKAVPTFWAEVGMIIEATDPSGDETTDPTLPVWAQLAEDVAELAEDVAELKASGGGSTGGGTGGSVEGAVLYTAQNLTEAQQEQARKNIGVDAYIEEVFLGGAW